MDRGAALFVEKSTFARKNLVVAGNPYPEPVNPQLWVIDPVTGTEIWHSPELIGTVPHDSLQFVDVDITGLVRDWATGFMDNHGVALQMLRSRPAELLITDMDMPGRDGAQTLEDARRLLPGLPVIAISGGARDGRQNWSTTALKRGATKALAKPFERQVLLSAVADVVPRDKSGAVNV